MDDNNNSENRGCGEESLSITAWPSIERIPDRSSGVCDAVLNDTATLSGGSNYTGDGTITFNLYRPGDPNCDGEPAYTQVVDNITADGDYSTLDRKSVV